MRPPAPSVWLRSGRGEGARASGTRQIRGCAVSIGGRQGPVDLLIINANAPDKRVPQNSYAGEAEGFAGGMFIIVKPIRIQFGLVLMTLIDPVVKHFLLIRDPYWRFCFQIGRDKI